MALRNLFVVFILLSFELWAQKEFEQKGKASYYAHFHHGKVTANGETFNMYDFTAAHKTLPFNSLVKVTNLKNNRSIVVRINDRGPYFKDRILDLSRLAAYKLGIIHPGTAHVKLKVIGVHKKALQARLRRLDFEDFVPSVFYNVKGELVQPKGFGVQIAAFKDEQNAIKTCKKMEHKGYKSYIKVIEFGETRLYRIILGHLKTEERAEHLRIKLSAKGWEGFVTPLHQ